MSRTHRLENPTPQSSVEGSAGHPGQGEGVCGAWEGRAGRTAL